MSSTGLREHAHSFLEEWSRRVGYTASLAVLDGADVVYVDRVQSPRHSLKRRGPHTITGKRALSNEIKLVAESGMAIDGEECARGLVAIAAVASQFAEERQKHT